MGWWKADPIPEAPRPVRLPSPSDVPPHPIPPQPSSDTASACPVDPKTRAIWLQQAQAQQAKKSQPQSQGVTHLKSQVQSHFPPSHPPIPQSQSNPQTSTSSPECSSDHISQSPSTEPTSGYNPTRPLSHDRVISSIPRAFPQSSASPPSSTHSPSSNPSNPSTAIPANAESETGHHHPSGNWIYPSESQFFHAVMRKQTLTTSDPTDLAHSISSIIPIHNAVNERAWSLIKTWEAPATQTTATKTCNGPKLLSFQGLGAGAKSPKARMMGLWGYTEPFDRHDWIVERCDGRKVEYVIDFYQGKAPDANAGGGGRKGESNSLNFYLDVRPKLNSLEGWRMRAERMVGWR